MEDVKFPAIKGASESPSGTPATSSKPKRKLHQSTYRLRVSPCLSTSNTKYLLHGYSSVRVLRESYPINTNITGFSWFSKIHQKRMFVIL